MRRLLLVLVAILVLATGAVAFWRWHQARFEIAVTPRAAATAAQCQSMAATLHVTLSVACRVATELPWFHARVSNTGHSAAYAYCWAHGYDRSGATVSRVSLPPGVFGTPGLPRLAPGQTLVADWFYAEAPTGPVDH